MRMDLTPLSQGSTGGAVTESGVTATARVRGVVERSIAAIVPTGTNVIMDGSNAIISGTVASEYDRKLVERMAMLVPGVDSVQNDLVVQAKSTSKL
jgi:hypothetical protein